MIRSISEELLLETLAEVTHSLWCDWARGLIQAQQISKNTIENWKQYFVPYFELPEAAKELYRTEAKRYVTVLKKLFGDTLVC